MEKIVKIIINIPENDNTLNNLFSQAFTFK